MRIRISSFRREKVPNTLTSIYIKHSEVDASIWYCVCLNMFYKKCQYVTIINAVPKTSRRNLQILDHCKKIRHRIHNKVAKERQNLLHSILFFILLPFPTSFLSIKSLAGLMYLSGLIPIQIKNVLVSDLQYVFRFRAASQLIAEPIAFR